MDLTLIPRISILILCALTSFNTFTSGAVLSRHSLSLKEVYQCKDIHIQKSGLRSFVFDAKAKSSDWKYLTLTFQWPETFCIREHQSCQLPSIHNWTLHGLWPSTGPGSGPQSCNKSSAFDTSKIEDLLPDMEKYWPTLSKGHYNDSSFWAHEWCKHGTCAESLPSIDGEHAYFQKTLDLYQLYNPYNFLQPVGISPSTDHYYNPQDIAKAFTDALNVAPIISCYQTDGKSYIFQIELCLSKSFDLINCPGATLSTLVNSVSSSHCSTKVYYPPIPN